jgi:hypothetical protein
MRTNNRLSFVASLLLFLVFVAVPVAHTQSNTGTILGTVQDDSGASVPDAVIVVKSLGTGEERTLKSDGIGAFIFSDLQVGHYSITITRNGFSPIKIGDLELQLAQRFTINPVLHVGAVNDQVTVIATATPLLNTTSSSVGQVINTDIVQNMPLNGRNFWQLTQLTPGVSYIQGGQNIQTGGTSIRASAVNVNVNGLSPSWTGWYLDGANITEFQLGGTIIALRSSTPHSRAARTNFMVRLMSSSEITRQMPRTISMFHPWEQISAMSHSTATSSASLLADPSSKTILFSSSTFRKLCTTNSRFSGASSSAMPNARVTFRTNTARPRSFLSRPPIHPQGCLLPITAFQTRSTQQSFPLRRSIC